MSQETNELLQLFSRLLRTPRFMMALHVEMMRTRLRDKGGRRGAQGLLVELWKKDGLTNAEIAELLDIRPSSVTAQVKALEEAGLVTRVADDRDGRVSRIFLTDAGRERQDSREAAQTELSEAVFDGLTADERATLARLIEKIVTSNAGDVCDGKGWGPFGHGGFDPQAMREMHHEMHRMGREMREGFRDSLRQAHGWPDHDWWGGHHHGRKGADRPEDWDDF